MIIFITKTCLYKFDPLKPHFYIVKLGLTGVYIILLIVAQNHRLWILVRTASPSTHNLCFEQKYEKYQSFLSENFQFLEMKFSIYLNRRVFVMFQKIVFDISCMNCQRLFSRKNIYHYVFFFLQGHFMQIVPLGEVACNTKYYFQGKI